MKKILNLLRINTFRKKYLVSCLILFTAVSGVFLLFLFNPWNNSASAAWFNDNWGFRKAITVTVTSSASDISNLDTLITIDTTGITANLQTNCEDLRFTDVKGTILPYFNDSCTDNSASNTVWVRINTVPKNTTTYTLYMYYGNASAAAGSNSTLFSLYNGLEGYWAMNESSWNTTVGEIKDNSVNAAHGVSRGDATTTASGQFSRGALLDGSADSFSAPDNAGLELGASDFTVATWVYMTSLPNTGFGAALYAKDGGAAAFAPLDIVVRSTSADAENDIHVWMSTNGSSWDVMNDVDLGGGSSLTLSTWHHVAFIRESGVCKLYIDKVVTATTASGVACSGTLVNTTGTHYFGGQFQAPNGNGIAGRMDDARIYTRALSGTDLTNLYANPGAVATNVNATIVPSTSFAAEEKGSSPIAYWKFDDGQGTTVQDSTSNNKDGTLAASTATPTWQTEDQCIGGKCLYFDGTNDYASVASPNLPTGDFTYSAWVYSLDNSDDMIFMASDGATSNEFAVHLASTKVRINIDNSAVINTTNVFSMNTWNYLVVTRSGSTITVYVNGVADPTTGSSATAMNFSTCELLIGVDADSGCNGSLGNHFKGKIDEAKIYNQVLTAPQVLANYNARGNPEGVAGTLGANTQNMPDALSDGLVGYWKTDETSSTAADSSGNGLTLTNNNTVAYAGGKFGNAASFTAASSRYLSTATTISGVKTVSFWTNNASTTDEYINMIASTAYITSSSGTITATGFTSPTIYVNGVLNGTLTASVWNHVIVTTDTGINATALEVGRGNGSYNNGTIDETRIYNRALSGAEVSQLYNWAPGPVGYWKMDEKTGTVGADASGYVNNGTLGSSTALPTWTNGKYGSSLSFDGGDTFFVADSASLSITNGFSLSGWIKSTNVSGFKPIVTKEGGGQTGYFLYLNGANVYTGFGNSGFYSQTTSTAPITAGIWTHVASSWDGTTLRTYVNGVLLQSSTHGSTVADNSDNLGIGAAFDSSSTTNGVIDDVKVYNYARTQGQIIEDMNAGHPAPGSPVGSALGHWKFDGGYGTTAYNSGNAGSALNLTLSNHASPATSTSGWSNSGKFGKAFNFDGDNDDAAGPNDAVSDDLASMTISGWINPRSSGESNVGRIFDKSNSGAGVALMLDSGNVNFSVTHASTTLTRITNATVALNTWQHIAATWDGSTSASNVKIYINGIEQTSYLETTNGSGARTSDAAQAIRIGGRNDGARTFDGLIDEVKLYASSLTADQIKLDMNKSQAQVLGTAGDNTNFAKGAEAQKYCVPGDSSTCTGPVGEWNFDENTGSTTNDISGSGSSGSITGTTWKSGKSTPALNFNGGTDVVTVTGSLSTKTVSFWINPSTTTQNIMDLRTAATAASISVSGGTIAATGFTSPTIYVNGKISSTLVANQWQYVEITTDTTITSNAIRFGRISSTSLTGLLDQIRIYDYPRSPSQIAYDYNQGKPIAHWKMDECQGTTINDSASNSYPSTVNLGAGGTTSVGTCTSSGAWFNGVSGKRNSSLAFDGNDDDVSITGLMGSFQAVTLAAWVNLTTSDTSGAEVISIGDSVTLRADYTASPKTTGIFYNGSTFTSTGSQRDIAGTGWHHLIYTVDQSTSAQRLYIDGNLAGFTNISGAITYNQGTTTKIGEHAGSSPSTAYNFNGKIDDVRVYNYPLTASQAKTIFNEGAFRVGPVTGAP